MAAHGKDSYFAVEDSTATTIRDITPYVIDIDFDLGNEIADTTTKGAEGRTKRPGLTDGSISLTCLWDKTATVGSFTVLSSLVGIETTVGFEYGPEGNAAGTVKYSGECVLESYKESSPIGDMVGCSATFQISGSVTIGTFSA